ncbi:MAG TPA: hypothetical protein DCY24_08545 [Rikenellaceae bacterium]|nr:hypothetical protein [Rikenellaceae bacterium]
MHKTFLKDSFISYKKQIYRINFNFQILQGATQSNDCLWHYRTINRCFGFSNNIVIFATLLRLFLKNPQ